MSDAQSEADRIRNKRLAKLGTQAEPQAKSDDAGPSGPSDATGSNEQQHEAKKPKINITKSDTASSPSQKQASVLPESAAPSHIPTVNSGREEPQTRTKINISKTRTGQPETNSMWEDKILRDVFRISLEEGKNKDASGNRLVFVEGVRQELEEARKEADAPILMTSDLLEQAIIEAVSNDQSRSPLDYLLPCWKRVTKLLRQLKTKPDREKLEVVENAKRLCWSYCIFAVSMPGEMFGREASPEDELASHLILDQDHERGIDHDFLTEFAARLDTDDMAGEVFSDSLETLRGQLGQASMNGAFKGHVQALRNLVRYPALANAITQSSSFIPADIPAEAIETQTFLGPWFRLSPLEGEVTNNFFSSPKTRDKAYINNAQNSLRMSSRAHQTDLLDIVNHLVRASKEARERTLDWFALTVNLNHKRRALQVDPKTVSSDGFMLNVAVCLDQLCEPFMDATFSKIDRIDVDYLRRSPRVDIKDETKLNADQNASDEFYANQLEGQSNFISEVFFLALAAHHYGTEGVNASLRDLEKDIKYLEKNLAILEGERSKFAGNPAQLVLYERQVVKYRDQIDRFIAYKYAVQGVLLDDLNQTRSMQFMRYVIVWLLRLITPNHDFPQKPVKLPLPENGSDVVRCLPEYFLEDVVDNFKFIMRNMPNIISSTQSDELVMLCITFLINSEYIKNPYLKAGLITIMALGVWPYYGKSKGVLGDLLNSLPFATENLLHGLMKFYIEAEHTGAHTAFYDKFNIRYEIFQIIKCIWSNQVYRDKLSREAKVNLEFFVRFVNLLLNDVTYVLDSSLTDLNKIHDLQQTLANSPDLEPEMRAEKEKELSQTQDRAKSTMMLTNETVSMLKMFTDALADSFTMPEIVQRLADMLDYNLDAMVGPKSTKLRVENPGQYHFNPRALLSELVDVFLNLKDKENFITAVAKDGRSYKPENLETATVIMKKHALKSAEELKQWHLLGEKFRKAKELDDQDEEDLGEIPEEFLDPLMFTLMEDPVILPQSKTTVDRSTIRSHLLSDPNDPFNRAPLKIEDVIPNTELKAKIEQFKASKRRSNPDAMDTTDG